MALPSAGKKATSVFDAPPGDVAGFSVIIDMETELGSNTDFTGDINTTDANRSRWALDDSDTEIAFDWWADDVTSDLEEARAYVGTVLAASTDAARTIAIYSPNTRNTAYAATDTHGQYNAYGSDLECYYPDGDGTSDRTENQLNMSSTGTITGGGATGLLGAATTYGTGAYYDTAPVTDRPVTMLGWVYPTNTTPDTQTIIGLSPYQTAVSANASSMWRSGDNAHKSMCRFPNWAGPESTNAIDTLNTWYHTAAIYRGTDAADSIVDGGGKSSLTSLDSFSSVDTITLGAVSFLGYYGNFDMFQGRLQELAVYSAGVSDDFVSYEYSQTSDNSTFWGTWAVSDVSGGYTLDADSGTYSLTGTAVDLAINRVLTAEAGVYSLSGADVELLFNKALNAEAGEYSLTGEDVELIKGLLINAESGEYNLTGTDVEFVLNRALTADTGVYTLTGRSANLLYSGNLPTLQGRSPLGIKKKYYTKDKKRVYYILSELRGT